MTTCTLVLAVIKCVVAPGTVLAPAAAAAILAPHQFVYVAETPLPQGETVYSSPSSGPYGGLTLSIPPRRLDGSLWTEPQTVYGLPPWGGVPTAYSLPWGYPSHGGGIRGLGPGHSRDGSASSGLRARAGAPDRGASHQTRQAPTSSRPAVDAAPVMARDAPRVIVGTVTGGKRVLTR